MGNPEPVERPWEPLRLPRGGWASIACQPVEAAILWPTKVTSITRVWERVTGGVALDPIHVIAWDGAMWIIDGHHRVAYAKMCGKRRVLARVFRPPSRTEIGLTTTTDGGW